MKKDLLSRVKKGVYNTIAAGALAFGLYSCVNPPTQIQNRAPETTLSVNPISGLVPLESRVQYFCTDLDGQDDIDDSYVRIGNDTLRTKYLDSTITSVANSSVSSYCKDKGGLESRRGPISITVQEPLPQVVFWSNKDAGTGELYLADVPVAGSVTNVRRLTNNVVNDVWPAFSPDGSQIVFASNREDATGDGLFDTVLWLMAYDGANQRRLTPLGVEYASAPTWCADGRIYFNHWNIGANLQGISRLNSDGTGLERVMEESANNRLSGRPACSSNGTRIAYVRFKDGNSEVYMRDSNSSNEINITNNPANDNQPVFSPDGSKLYFVSDRDGGRDVFSVDLGNGNTQKVLIDSGAEIDPNWLGNNLLLTHDENEGITNPRVYMLLNSGGMRELVSFVSRYPAGRPQ